MSGRTKTRPSGGPWPARHRRRPRPGPGRGDARRHRAGVRVNSVVGRGTGGRRHADRQQHHAHRCACHRICRPAGSGVAVPVADHRQRSEWDHLGRQRHPQRGDHGIAQDIDVLLVGPAGQNLVLMSDVANAGGFAVNGTLTFDDGAAGSIPASGTVGTGTYRPTNANDGADTFPAPAPAPSSATRSLRVQRDQPQRPLAAVCPRRHQRRYRLDRWWVVDHGHHRRGRPARGPAVHDRRLPRRRRARHAPPDPATGRGQRRGGLGHRVHRHPGDSHTRSRLHRAQPDGQLRRRTDHGHRPAHHHRRRHRRGCRRDAHRFAVQPRRRGHARQSEHGRRDHRRQRRDLRHHPDQHPRHRHRRRCPAPRRPVPRTRSRHRRAHQHCRRGSHAHRVQPPGAGRR